MAKIKYTPSQQEVIDFRGNNLLVSAGAGSGKTTIMIERIAALMTDKEHPTPISRFLIISFTKASAADMKNKLIEKLMKLEPTPYILEQLDDILTSDVSNLHSFCAKLLKQYFYEVSLDPTFIIFDESEASILKQKALDKLFKELSSVSDKEFLSLIDIFSRSRKDANLRWVILKIYDFLCSLTHKKSWFERTINTLYETDFEHSSAAKIVLSHIRAERERMLLEARQFIQKCEKMGEKKLLAYAQELETKILSVRADEDFLRTAKRLMELPKLSRIPSVSEEFEFLKTEICDFKDDVSYRFKKLIEYSCAENLENISAMLMATQQHVYNLYKLVLKFSEYYDELKLAQCGLDFNDLEKYTLKVLENPALLEEIKNKYDYIMVDEYQDINEVQEKILSLLSRENNRFMVGDVKQSIYRFRLCDPEIFIDKYNRYSQPLGEGKLIKLNENFRSKKEILDFVNAVFNETMTKDFGDMDYKKEAQLVSGLDSERAKKRIGFLLADTSSDQEKEEVLSSVYSVKEDTMRASLDEKAISEALLIAKKISELVKNETIEEKGKKRKLKFSDITILVPARNEYLQKMIETLERVGIPVVSDIEGDCFDDEYVYAIKCFLELVACEKVDFRVFATMKSKLFDFSSSELAELKIHGGDEKFFYQNIQKARQSGELTEPLNIKLESFYNILATYREKAKFLSAKELIKEIFKQLSLALKIAADERAKEHQEKLDRLLQSMGEETVFEFLAKIEDSSIKCEASSAHGAVRVMTIHKSKGLEFKVVFLAMATRPFNLESVRNDIVISKDLGICMDFYDRDLRYKNSNLAREAVRLVETRKMLEEEQRLLYVALTRATHFLYISAATKVDNIKGKMPASPMCFMDFMGHLIARVHENLADYDITIANAKELALAGEELKGPQIILNDFDEAGMSSVKQILTKPYAFEKSVYRPLKSAVTSLVREKSEEEYVPVMFTDSISSAERGTLYHWVLANIDFKKSSQEELDFELQKFEEEGRITEAERRMIDPCAISKLLSNAEFKQLFVGALKVYKEKEFYMLYRLDGDDSVVQGIVDLLIIKEDEMVVVDYKTGNITQDRLDKYALQLELYSEAMQKSFSKKVTKKCIASLETGKLYFV